MIFAIIVALSTLRLSIASSGQFHDIHAACEQDLKMFCSDFLQQEEIVDKKLRRRLTEESDEVTTTRSYSVTIARNLGNKKEALPIQRAKDSKRFLSYGIEADTCLWNAFDSQKLSDKCTSALMHVNDSVDYTVKKDGYISRYSATTVSNLFSTISIAIVCFFIYKYLTSEEDNDADEESANESELTAFIAVPLTVSSEKNGKCYGSRGSGGKAFSSSTSSQDLPGLKTEKQTLHQMLRSYEKDFYNLHSRQVSCYADIRPVATQYRRYKEIKKQISALQESSGEKK